MSKERIEMTKIYPVTPLDKIKTKLIINVESFFTFNEGKYFDEKRERDRNSKREKEKTTLFRFD